MMVFLASALVAAFPAFSAQNHVSDAGVVKYLNPGPSKVLSGSIVDLGYRYGVAGGDIASNKTGAVFTEGVWLLARADTNAITLGANVYQNTSSNVTGTAAGNRYIGECVEAAAGCASVYGSDGLPSQWVKVDIGAPQRAIIVGTDIQAHSANLDKVALKDAESLTNLPITIVPVDIAIVTNATVGGAALSGVGAVVTNVTLNLFWSGNLYDVSSTVISNAAGDAVNCVTNVTLTLQTGTPSVSSPTISLETGTAVKSATATNP